LLRWSFLDHRGGREVFQTVRELGPLTEWSYSLKILDEDYGPALMARRCVA
jgi:hypothetical protein